MLCGCLGSCAALINLVTFNDDDTHKQMTADLLSWYSQTEMPSNRFDAIATFTNQYKEAPNSPLCHVSVSSWILKAGVNYKAPERKDRCAKVTADVVYQTVLMLNDYAAGKKHTPIAAKLSNETDDCMSCHGKDADNNVTIQQDCLSCHDDHTK